MQHCWLYLSRVHFLQSNRKRYKSRSRTVANILGRLRVLQRHRSIQRHLTGLDPALLSSQAELSVLAFHAINEGRHFSIYQLGGSISQDQ